MGQVLHFKQRTQTHDNPDIANLARLAGVAIVIEDLDSPLTKAGLNRTTLQHNVERQLSEGGVPVLTLQQAEESDDAAYLVVALRAELHPSGVVASMLNLELCEIGFFPRSEERGGCVATWHLNGLWAFDRQRLAEAMNDAVEDGVKRFVKDFRRANA